MKDSNPVGAEPLGQNLIKVISNVCFSGFVFLVLIFTAVAVNYQPPDPWLDSAPALAELFAGNDNATFKNDNSILRTGEDLGTSAVSPVPPPVAVGAALAAAPPVITEATIEKAEEKMENSTAKSGSAAAATCDELAGEAVNCSDPRVLIAIERFNLRAFRSIVFLDYQAPVNGSKPDECDVLWRFRNKRETSISICLFFCCI